MHLLNMTDEPNDANDPNDTSENQASRWQMDTNAWKTLGAVSRSSMPRPSGIGKRNINFAPSIPLTKESKVKVIYAGGVIGMVRNDNNVLSAIPNALIKELRRYPYFHDEKYSLKRFGVLGRKNILVLPYSPGVTNRVVYSLVEYEPLRSSSNMALDDWVHIAKDIHQSYEFFDAFVVLHGTDTLAYTASALSFMLENLGKTVILTGSQMPIFETRSDGKDNFTTAIILAGNFIIPEVCILFGNKLMRGNRTVKTSCDDLDAFDSPNFPPLGRIGIKYAIEHRLIYRPCNLSRCEVHVDMDLNVGLVRLFPGMTAATFRSFLAPHIKGVVLQSFGPGNIPTNRQDILDEIAAATKRGVIIVNCTQCLNGTVADAFDVGMVFSEFGVIPGYDMTPEAAITKLSYVIGKADWTLEFKKKTMRSSIRGELSSENPQIQEHDLIQAVGQSLRVSSPQEFTQLGQTLFPALIHSAVVSGDIKKIQSLKTCGADLSGVNQDNRSALHIACRQGNLEIVNMLLKDGVSVHLRDRYDRTPLMEAISIDNHDIIKLLISCGAHLTASRKEVGEQLCSATAEGSLVRLESYELAGANMASQDPSGRTALHVAAVHGHLLIVEYLLRILESINTKDMLGLTPLHYAKRMENTDIIELLATRLK